MNTKRILFLLIVVLSLAIIFVACEGPIGPPGESVQGPAGQDGADGTDGQDARYFLNIGPFTSEHIVSNQTRGFYFQAPVNFVIYDLQVPDNIGGDVQNIAVVRFDNEPPNWSSPPATNDFEVLYYETDMPSEERAVVNIEVSAGDYIGILGTRGTILMHNAYGPTSGHTSSIKGVSVNLYRLGMQSNLNSTPPQNLWSEPIRQISQVHLRYF